MKQAIELLIPEWAIELAESLGNLEDEPVLTVLERAVLVGLIWFRNEAEQP